MRAVLAMPAPTSKTWAIAQAKRVYAEAMMHKQFGAANKALEHLARLQGQIVEPTRTVRVIQSMADLTDEEINRLAAGQGVDDVVLAWVPQEPAPAGIAQRQAESRAW
jgi:hypothetical protein